MMDMKEMDMEEADTTGEKKYGKYQEWEIESAAECLKEAEEIKADAEKMKYVKQYLAEDQKSTAKIIGSIDELKAVAKSKMGNE